MVDVDAVPPPHDPAAAFAARQRAMWAAGDLARVTREIGADVAPALVAFVAVGAGERVLDVAAGTGPVAVAAARAGAVVVASDFVPELVEAGRIASAEAGVDVSWQVGDAMSLPDDDASFDVVLSSMGVMFAPNHERAASEVLRVVRPGGRVGLAAWTPGSFVGRLFAAVQAYVPPPPPGVRPAPLWGDARHVAELFGDGVESVRAELRETVVDRFREPQELLRYYSAHFGPLIGIGRALQGRPDDRARLDADVVALAREFLDRSEGGAMRWEYLLWTGARRG